MHETKRNRIRKACHTITTEHLYKVAAGAGLSASDLSTMLAEVVPEASPQEIVEFLKGDQERD